MLNLNQRLVAPALLLTLFACGFESVKMINFNADIVDVKQVSDSSIELSIEVYDRGNASMCYMYIYYDTIAQEYLSHRTLITSANDCKLQDNYEFVLGGLKKDTTYFLRLGGWGNHDLGGPNDSRFDFMGRTVEFTIR